MINVSFQNSPIHPSRLSRAQLSLKSVAQAPVLSHYSFHSFSKICVWYRQTREGIWRKSSDPKLKWNPRGNLLLLNITNNKTYQQFHLYLQEARLYNYRCVEENMIFFMDMKGEDKMEPWLHESSSLKIFNGKRKRATLCCGCLPVALEPCDFNWVKTECQRRKNCVDTIVLCTIKCNANKNSKRILHWVWQAFHMFQGKD